MCKGRRFVDDDAARDWCFGIATVDGVMKRASDRTATATGVESSTDEHKNCRYRKHYANDRFSNVRLMCGIEFRFYKKVGVAKQLKGGNFRR